MSVRSMSVRVPAEDPLMRPYRMYPIALSTVEGSLYRSLYSEILYSAEFGLLLGMV